MSLYLRGNLLLFVFLTVLLGGIYPALSTVLVQTAFPKQVQGSLIVKDGKVLGSELIGQNFSDPKYFWGRLSATSPTPYNAAASSGSNISPSNPVLLDAVKARIAALRQADPANTKLVPVDLVTASGSGLDPHISQAAAEYQLARVAKARGISEDSVRSVIQKHTEARQLGVLGEPTVNVLTLNLELDGRL